MFFNESLKKQYRAIRLARLSMLLESVHLLLKWSKKL